MLSSLQSKEGERKAQMHLIEKDVSTEKYGYNLWITWLKEDLRV